MVQRIMNDIEWYKEEQKAPYQSMPISKPLLICATHMGQVLNQSNDCSEAI